MLFQCLTLLLSKGIMGQILDLTFCISIHPTVLKAITCILCVSAGMGSHLARVLFTLQLSSRSFLPPLTAAAQQASSRCLASSEMALGGGEQGCKQVETVLSWWLAFPRPGTPPDVKTGLQGNREEKAGSGAGGRGGLNPLSKGGQPSTQTSYETKQAQCQGGGNGPCLGIGNPSATFTCSRFMCASVCGIKCVCKYPHMRVWECTVVCGCLHIVVCFPTPVWMPVCYLCVCAYRSGCPGECMLVSVYTCLRVHIWSLHVCMTARMARYICLCTVCIWGIVGLYEKRAGCGSAPHPSFWWSGLAWPWKPLQSWPGRGALFC